MEGAWESPGRSRAKWWPVDGMADSEVETTAPCVVLRLGRPSADGKGGTPDTKNLELKVTTLS